MHPAPGNLWQSLLAILLLGLGLYGWGVLAALLFRLPNRVDAGLRVAWGLALLLTIGGGLNWLKIASPPVLSALGGLGVLTTVVYSWLKRTSIGPDLKARLAELRGQPVGACLFAGALLVLAASLISSSNPTYNDHDDAHGYLVFTARMIQTGEVGPDPFNERRLLALGGQNLLQTMLVGLGNPLWHPNVWETGAANVIIVLLLLGHARQRRLSLAKTALALWMWLIIRPPGVNTSSLISGAVMFFALLRTFALAESSKTFIPWLGLMVAGAVSLKNSHAGGIGVLLVFFFATRAGPVTERALKLLRAGFWAFLFIFPWLLAMHASHQTGFYPFLGKGYYGPEGFPRFHATLLESLQILLQPDTWLELCRYFDLWAVLLLMAAVGISWRARPIGCAAVAAASAIVALVAMVFLGDGSNVRYAFPFMAAALFYLLVEALEQDLSIAPWLSRANQAPNKLSFQNRLTVWLVGASFFVTHPIRISSPLTFAKIQLPALLQANPAVNWNTAQARLRAVQAAAPAGASILACHSKPFLLDFTRNKIFVVDHPGAAGPSGGLPCFGNVEGLRRYLTGQGIRHVLYSYGDNANYGRAVVGGRLGQTDSFYSNRVRLLAVYSISFQELLRQLRSRSLVLKDDGHTVLVDISAAPR